MQAQLLSAINDTPEGGTLFTDEVQVSGRHNAPQAIYTNHFDWKDVAPSAGHGTRYTFLGPKYYSSYYGQYTRDMFYTKTIMIADGYKANNNSINTAKPAITLYLTYSASNGLMDYGAETLPSQATYTVQTSSYSAALCNIVDYGSLSASDECASKNKWGNCVQWNYYNCFQDDNGNLLYGNNTPNSKIFATSVTAGGANFTSGSLTFTAGRHGYPYVYSTNLTSGSNTYNVTIGDSRHLTTTYTSCRVATDEENGKAVLQAYDGTNTLTLVFNITTADANIGIPAKQYTVGTDVWGGCTDNDGYTRWMFKSGKITISKSSNNLSMTTSSLKGTSSGGDFDMNLTISSKTPNKTFTAVNLSEGKISGYDDTNYSPFLVSGSQSNDKINIYMPFTQASNFTSSQKFAAFFGPDQNGDYASSSYITKNGTKYVMSQGVAVVNYDKTYQVAELTSAYLNSGTFYYIHTITSQVNNSNGWNKFYFSGERNEAFSATFDAATPADHDAEKAHFSVNNGSQSMYLTFYTDDTKDGVVPSGTYDVRATKKDNTVYVGTYSSGLLDSRGQQSSYWWLLRFGTVEVFNLNETYYITQGTTLLSARDNNMTFTIGTAPKDVTLTTPAANGTAQIQFTATNWNNKVIDYASGTAHKFFQGQTISLQATPASGYQVAYWTLGGVKIDGSELQDTYSYTVGSGATQTLAAVFEQAITNHTVSITAPTNGTITVSYNDGSAQSFTSGSRDIADGTVLTVTTTPADDYHFGAWTGNGAASVTVNGDKTIGATFAQNDYFLNATYGAGGASVTRNDNGNNLTVKRAGNTVTLTPTAANGYEFLAWAGDDAAKISNNVFTFPANGTHNTTYNVQATFQAITYDISYEGLEGATNTNNPTSYTIETATFALADPGTRTGYTFNNWTCGGDAITQITLGSTGDKTITANWTPNTNTAYTVKHYQQNLTLDGYTEVEGDRQNLTGTTAASTAAEAKSYTGFTAQSFSQGTIAADGTTVVSIYYNRNLFTITWKNGETTLETDANVPYGATPTYNGETDPTRADDEENNIAYSFIGWKSSADENVYTTANLPVATAEVTYTAQYEPYFLIRDDKENNDAYYGALAAQAGKTLDVKYKRTFPKGRWSTLSLPFAYSFRTNINPFDGKLYYLISANYTAGGYLTLNCMPVTTGIEANKAYILILGEEDENIVNPTFKGAKMKGLEHKYYTAPNVDGIGNGVIFRNTIERETLEKDKRVIYLSGNRLYYPNLAPEASSWIYPFRGYFYLNIAEGQIQYSPARVRLVNEEGETIETLPEASEETSAEVKKYIENGILVIERAGIKYDAQGHIIK